jgi:hypothetical protein
MSTNPVEFSENIIPNFIPLTPTDQSSPSYAWSEKWGVWSIVHSKSTGYGSVFVVDGDDNTCFQSNDSTLITLSAPVGKAINPKTITIKYNRVAKSSPSYLKAYDPLIQTEDDTQRWVNLAEIPPTSSITTFTYTAPEGDSAYYTKFAVSIPDYGTNDRTCIYSFSIDAGTVRYQS